MRSYKPAGHKHRLYREREHPFVRCGVIQGGAARCWRAGLAGMTENGAEH